MSTRKQKACLWGYVLWAGIMAEWWWSTRYRARKGPLDAQLTARVW